MSIRPTEFVSHRDGVSFQLETTADLRRRAVGSASDLQGVAGLRWTDVFVSIGVLTGALMEQLFPGLTHAQNLHPIAVHFPIAFWIAAAGAWLVSAALRREQAWRFGLWLQTWGLVGAVFAVGLGYEAMEKMQRDSPGHDLIHVHRDFMLVATGLAVLITAVGWWRREAARPWRVGLAAASALLVGVAAIGADRGAELVYRYGIGVAGESPPDSSGYDHGDGGHVPQTQGHGQGKRSSGDAPADDGHGGRKAENPREEHSHELNEPGSTELTPAATATPNDHATSTGSSPPPRASVDARPSAPPAPPTLPPRSQHHDEGDHGH